MPMVHINPKTGPADINYTISTPSCPSADKIDPKIPTVIFVHPVYIGHVIFQPQFSDPQLRRFNLIGVDMRLHGETKGVMSSDWRREDAGDDLAAFMDALNLPPCHLVGMSMGACISLQTGVSYPDKVLSLFLISPLPLEEPEEVREGRQEIYDCWAAGWRNYPDIDEGAFMDALLGTSQLAYNNVRTTLSDVLSEYSLPRAMRNFNKDRLEEFHTASVKFFADRAPHSLEKLRRLKCPVQLVQSGGDVAYPIFFAQELLQRLLSAGVDAELDVVEGAPHFGTVTHYEEFNPLIHDFIISNTVYDVPPPPEVVTSPFEAYLVSLGWTPGADETDFDEDEYSFDFRAALPWAYPPSS